MSHPLDGPLLKLERAICQIDLLRTRQKALWQDREHKIVRSEVNPKNGKVRYRARGDFSLSLEWGVTIGEIGHNLRSALDGVTYALAKKDGADAETLARTYFPIHLVGRTKRHRRRKPGGGPPGLIPHFECDGRNQIKGLSHEHQAMVERLQPYHRRREDGAFRTTHPLYWLHEINNTDKHRVIQVIGYRGTGIVFGGFAQDDDDPMRVFDEVIYHGSKGILKNGAVVFEAPPHMQVNPTLMPMVAFAEGKIGIRNQWIVGRLQNAAEAVATVLSKFWDEF